MANPLQKAALIALCALFSAQIHCQNLSIKRVEIDSDKLYVIYDLADTARGRTYTVNLYSSRDNFVNPVEKLRGDFGLEVIPGSNRRIEWNAKEELGAQFEGKVSVEVRAKAYIPFIRLEDLSKLKKIKRGKATHITWTGGRPQNILNFELYNGEQKVATIPNVANVGSHNIIIPLDTKPGKEYRFKVSDSRNRDEVVFSTTFAVSRKIPLVYKTVPGAAIVGVAVFLLTRTKDECPECIEEFPPHP